MKVFLSKEAKTILEFGNFLRVENLSLSELLAEFISFLVEVFPLLINLDSLFVPVLWQIFIHAKSLESC